MVVLGIMYGREIIAMDVGFGYCMSDPAANDGRAVYLSLVKVASLGPDSYRVSRFNEEVPILGDPKGLDPGDTLSVTGRFDAAREIVVEEYREVHRLRPLKFALGILGALLLPFYVLRSFQIRDGRLVVRDGPHA